MFTPTRASGLVYGPGNLPPVLGYPAIIGNADAMRYYQRTLSAAGHPVAVDGVWGDETRHAVRSYQQHKRITVDGLLGPETQRSLQSEPVRPAPAAPSLANAPPTQVPVVRPPPASEWDTAPVTRIHLPDQPWWQDVPSTRGFLDNVTIAPSVGAPSGTSPWVAVAAGAALLTGMIALARYYDEKKTR